MVFAAAIDAEMVLTNCSYSGFQQGTGIVDADNSILNFTDISVSNSDGESKMASAFFLSPLRRLLLLTTRASFLGNSLHNNRCQGIHHQLQVQIDAKLSVSLSTFL